MKKLNPLIVLIFVVVLCCASACNGYECSLTNLTPPEFPTSSQDLLRSTSISEELLSIPGVREGLDAHRFMLLVESSNTSDVSPMIIVDGTEQFMDEYGEGLWYFESKDQCNDKYEYYFQVGCGAPRAFSPPTVVELGSAADPYMVRAQLWSDVGWFDSGSGLMHEQDGNVEVTPQGNARIIVQSMREQATIESIEFYPDETADDNSNFEILDLPTLPVVLSCGKSIEFQVAWENGNTVDDGTIEIVVSWPDPDTPEQSADKSMYIHLSGQVPQ